MAPHSDQPSHRIRTRSPRGWPSLSAGVTPARGLRSNSPRDLRLCGLAPCALAPPRRGWRGNHPVPLDWRELAQRRAAATLPPSKGVQLVPLLTSSARRSGMLRQASAGTCSRQAVRIGAAALALPLLAPGILRSEPSGRACPPSSPSSPPMRCPGSGLQRSCRLLARSPCARLGDREGPRRLRIRSAVANLPSPPRQPCWRTKFANVAVSTSTKAPEGLESCRRGRGSL
jgi:hypothetical protein